MSSEITCCESSGWHMLTWVASAGGCNQACERLSVRPRCCCVDQRRCSCSPVCSCLVHCAPPAPMLAFVCPLSVAQKLDVGLVWINDHHRNDPSSPWGGMKVRNIWISTSHAMSFEKSDWRRILVWGGRTGGTHCENIRKRNLSW